MIVHEKTKPRSWHPRSKTSRVEDKICYSTSVVIPLCFSQSEDVSNAVDLAMDQFKQINILINSRYALTLHTANFRANMAAFSGTCKYLFHKQMAELCNPDVAKQQTTHLLGHHWWTDQYSVLSGRRKTL